MNVRNGFFKAKKSIGNCLSFFKWPLATAAAAVIIDGGLSALGAKILGFDPKEAIKVGALGGAVTGPIMGALMKKLHDKYAPQASDEDEAFLSAFFRTVITASPAALDALYPLLGFLLMEAIEGTKMSINDEYSAAAALFNSGLGITIFALVVLASCCLSTSPIRAYDLDDDEENELREPLMNGVRDEEKSIFGPAGN